MSKKNNEISKRTYESKDSKKNLFNLKNSGNKKGRGKEDTSKMSMKVNIEEQFRFKSQVKSMKIYAKKF